MGRNQLCSKGSNYFFILAVVLNLQLTLLNPFIIVFLFCWQRITVTTYMDRAYGTSSLAAHCPPGWRPSGFTPGYNIDRAYGTPYSRSGTPIIGTLLLQRIKNQMQFLITQKSAEDR